MAEQTHVTQTAEKKKNDSNLSAQKTGTSKPGYIPAEQPAVELLLNLQQTIGNRQVTRLLQKNSGKENEKDQRRDQPVQVSQTLNPKMIQRLLICDSLLREREAVRVGGTAAHNAIIADFTSQVGADAFPIASIPGSSWSHSRTACGDEPPSTVQLPQVVGGRTGGGLPDLSLRNGTNIELAEIKPAHFTCIPEAEQQVNNYKDKGNAAFNQPWRTRNNITSIGLMSPGRFSPTTPTFVGSEPVTISWCEPGVIVYKAIRDRDPAVFVCATSDQGKIDDFLDRILGRAQAQVNRYIDTVLNRAISAAIRGLTVRQLINTLYRYGRDALRQFVASQFGETVAAAIFLLPADQIVDAIALRIEQALGTQVEQLIRTMAEFVKTTLLNSIRQQIQANLRNLLAETLTALCVGAAVITAQQILDLFLRNLPRLAANALVQVLQTQLQQIMQALQQAANTILMILLAIAIVIVAVVFVISILDVAPGDEVAVGAALAAMVRLFMQMLRGPIPAF